jgi:sec-independent protein translocase protein TatA
MRFGPVEIGLILVIILIVFGAGKLPQVGSALGKSIREFRKASRGDNDETSTDPKLTQDSAVEKPTKS